MFTAPSITAPPPSLTGGPLEAILGAAGSGKSYLINERIQQNPEYGYRASSTGISAVNLGGRTINSTLGYFDLPSLIKKLQDEDGREKLYKTLVNIRSRYRYLIIDEVGMLCGNVLALIIMAIKEVNSRTSKHPPLGLLVVGDPGQLPVVARESWTIPFFECPYWGEFNITRLTEIKRQSDREFIEALNLIRQGDASETLDYFRGLGFHPTLDQDYAGTTLLTTNATVDSYNKRALDKLPGAPWLYCIRKGGAQDSGWKNLPDPLTIKAGARVILLANHHTEGYANGDTAIVDRIFAREVLVTLERTKRQHLIGYLHRDNTAPDGRTLGWIEYIPLRLAYGLTVHRAQSLTLDRVQIDLGSGFLRRLSGGLYTALSRARTPDGLRLVGTPAQLQSACYLDPKYATWVHQT